MSYETNTSGYPSAQPQKQATASGGDNRKVIYAMLIIALIATWGYIWYDKNKSTEQITQLEQKNDALDSTRAALQVEFDAALQRGDSLAESNVQLQGELAEKQAEIERKKAEIRRELSKKDGDLKKAKALIAELRTQTEELLAEVAKLKAENQQLTSANQQLSTEKEQLSTAKKQVEENLAATESEKNRLQDVASTLHASNINITAINIKGSGSEKETNTAKRADALRISFVIDENRIAPSGPKELYVIVYNPEGQVVSTPGTSGNFNTRDDGQKTFTSKVQVNYEQGKITPVSFDWKQESRYATGQYKIEIYHNGYKIGEGYKTLKKGGLFS
ncbi:MAG: hypothetical protein ACK4HE_05765 [Chitinophagaceae bacterium]